MRLVTTLIALVLLAIPPLAPALAAQERSNSAVRTDRSIDVTRGTRLRLESRSGAVIVRGWDKAVVRVQARHSSSSRVTVRTVKSVVSIASDSNHGAPGAVEYEIDVPRWMAVSVELTLGDITIEGTESDVAAETVRGQVTVKGGAGSVKAESVTGRIVVEHARARVDASSVSDSIRIDRVVGDVAADTTNGAITLTGIQSAAVEATTVNGSITYEGTVADDGHYTFESHHGNIVVSIPTRSNVTFDVRTYNGRFKSDLPVKGEPAVRRGAHGLFILGSGGARMELESFGGSIQVRDSAVKER